MALVPFKVKSVQMHGGFCTLAANPQKKFKFGAGQFAKAYAAPGSRDFVVLSFYSAENEKDVQFLFHPGEGGIKLSLSRMKKGEIFYIEGPLGIFTLRGTRAPKVFLAKKMGIAPVCSMVRTLIAKKPCPEAYVFSENMSREEIPDEKELRACAAEKKVRLFMTLLNQKPLNWDGKVGEFTAEDITSALKDYGRAEYYICGPLPFVNRMRSILHGLRVQEKNIFFEQWG